MFIFFFQWNISTNIGWITMTFCTDIHGPQRMVMTHDPLTPLAHFNFLFQVSCNTSVVLFLVFFLFFFSLSWIDLFQILLYSILVYDYTWPLNWIELNWLLINIIIIHFIFFIFLPLCCCNTLWWGPGLAHREGGDGSGKQHQGRFGLEMVSNHCPFVI